jgi:hypothetical protein
LAQKKAERRVPLLPSCLGGAFLVQLLKSRNGFWLGEPNVTLPGKDAGKASLKADWMHILRSWYATVAMTTRGVASWRPFAPSNMRSPAKVTKKLSNTVQQR